MSSEDEDMENKYFPVRSETPEELIRPATTNHVLPALSKHKYNKAYDDFQKWNKVKGATPVSQNVLMKYFSELSDKNKPSTLWAIYSMIKATLRSNDNIDITSWSKLLKFVKRENAGYKPVKATAFTEEEIEQFMTEAPDEEWLIVKVVCIFGLNGTFSGYKLVNMKVDHIKEYENVYWVIIPNAEVKESFTISGAFYNIVKKYAALRPKTTKHSRFFLQYSDNKCTDQPVGQNQFYKMPRKIAKYLKLPEPERYSGPSFRISTAIEFLARQSSRMISSANMTHDDARNSTSEAGSCIDQPTEFSLDYETGLLYTSSVRCTTPPVSFTSSKNDNTTEHECTNSCSQVKCVKEDNEKNVFHAFSIMKLSDYAITEVIPAQFASDPTCRWMVAYSNFVEPVSSYNSEEKFDEITRSIPKNVKVIQKYIRCNSSKLFAAYVVVYGVKCRCQKPIFGTIAAQPPDVFRKQSFDPLLEPTPDVFSKQDFDPLSTAAKPSDELCFSIKQEL